MNDINVYLSAPSLICAAGNSSKDLWYSVTNGVQSGIKHITALDGTDFYAGRIDENLLTPSSARYEMHIMRIEDFALRGLEKQINAAKAKYADDRIAVCVGSCDNGTEISLAAHKKYFECGTFPAGYSLEAQGAPLVASFIKEKYALKGIALAFSTACSSGAGAIIKAAELLKSGLCDAVIAGGVDIASDTALIGFNSLEAISPEITNPFSKNRRGITLGDAAAFFVMTQEVLNNEETPPVRLLGYGESADAYHSTSPDPSGEGAAAAMKKALESANISPECVDYLNLHGTGTKFNDSMEAIAVEKVFDSYKVPVSTTKPVTGHTLGAAGALEASVCYNALVQNYGKSGSELRLPVQVWDGVRDDTFPEINIIDRCNMNTLGKVQICMSNSFAFGGANASLILGF